jgi:hypothetical protein
MAIKIIIDEKNSINIEGTAQFKSNVLDMLEPIFVASEHYHALTTGGWSAEALKHEADLLKIAISEGRLFRGKYIQQIDNKYVGDSDLSDQNQTNEDFDKTKAPAENTASAV